MSVESIAVTGLTSVGLVELYIHRELVGFVTDPTVSSRSKDRHSDELGFGDAISDRREYGMMLSVL